MSFYNALKWYMSSTQTKKLISARNGWKWTMDDKKKTIYSRTTAHL